MDKSLIEPLLGKLKNIIVKSILEENGCKDYKDIMKNFGISEIYEPIFQFLGKQDDKRQLIWEAIKHWTIKNKSENLTINMLLSILQNLGYQKTNGKSILQLRSNFKKNIFLKEIILSHVEAAQFIGPIHIPRNAEMKIAENIFQNSNVLLIEGDVGVGKTYFTKLLCGTKIIFWLSLNDFKSCITEIFNSLNLELFEDDDENLKKILTGNLEIVILDFCNFEIPMHRETVTTCLKYQSEFFFKLIVVSRKICRDIFECKNSLLKIEPFTLTDAKIYLRHSGITNEQFIKKCFNFSNGNPRLLQKLINLYNKEGHEDKTFAKLFDHLRISENIELKDNKQSGENLKSTIISTYKVEKNVKRKDDVSVVEEFHQNQKKKFQPFDPNFVPYVSREDFLGINFVNLEEFDKQSILIGMFPKLEYHSSDKMKLALAVLREDDDLTKAMFNAKYGTVVKKRYDFIVILSILFVSAFTDLITINNVSGESKMLFTSIASSLITLVSQVDHWRKKKFFSGTDAFMGVIFAFERLLKVSVEGWKLSINLSVPDWIVPLFTMYMMFISLCLKHYVSELTVLTLFVNCAFICVLVKKNYAIIFILLAWVFKRFDMTNFDRNFVMHAKSLKSLIFSLIGLIFTMYLTSSLIPLIYGQPHDV